MRQVGADYLREAGRCWGERSIFGNPWMWDGEIEGANQDVFKYGGKDFGVPKPGAARFPLEQVTRAGLAPDLKAARAARLFKNYCLASQGYPEHFFDDTGDVNRVKPMAMHDSEPVANSQPKLYAPIARRGVNPEKSPKPQVVK
jgi:hypothetical protein